MTTDQLLQQRALGAVLGSAAGDALGAPFEFGSPGDYARRFPTPVTGGIGEQIGGGIAWAPGEFTDDTQRAVIQARSLLACDGIDGADLFERFREWARTAKDVGNQTRSALGSGLAWDEAAAAYFARGVTDAAAAPATRRPCPPPRRWS